MSGFLSEDNGNKSAMRLMCLMSLSAAIAFGWLVVTGRGSNDGPLIVYAFLGCAFAPKVAQKYLEGKLGVPPHE